PYAHRFTELIPRLEVLIRNLFKWFDAKPPGGGAELDRQVETVLEVFGRYIQDSETLGFASSLLENILGERVGDPNIYTKLRRAVLDDPCLETYNLYHITLDVLHQSIASDLELATTCYVNWVDKPRPLWRSLLVFMALRRLAEMGGRIEANKLDKLLGPHLASVLPATFEWVEIVDNRLYLLQTGFELVLPPYVRDRILEIKKPFLTDENIYLFAKNLVNHAEAKEQGSNLFNRYTLLRVLVGLRGGTTIQHLEKVTGLEKNRLLELLEEFELVGMVLRSGPLVELLNPNPLLKGFKDLGTVSISQDFAPSLYAWEEDPGFGEELERFVLESQQCYPGGVYQRIREMIAPYLSGENHLKEAVCLALASTPSQPVHLLMVGNPATVKTDILDEVKQIFPYSERGGPRSSEAGLTIDARTGEPGLLLRANQGFALIDELDKINRNEISAVYEALESGRLTVQVAGLNRTFNTSFICFAAANPLGQIFSDNPDKMRQQIFGAVPPALLSRFHLVFLLGEETIASRKRALAKILLRNGKENPHREFLRKYYHYIWSHHPKVGFSFGEDSPIVGEAVEFANRIIEDSQHGKILVPYDKRIMSSIRRLSCASARMRLSNTVSEEDVRLAMRVVDKAVRTALNRYSSSYL
ncbi:MAG: hypothetical protein DRO11_06345, partial [Methanobacteriota archaeon]